MRLVRADFFNNLLTPRLRLNIALEGVNVSSNFFRRSVEGLLPPSDDVDLGPVHGEALRDTLAEAGAATGYDDDLTLDGEEVFDFERDVLRGGHGD